MRMVEDSTYLDDGLTPYKMRPAPHGYTPSLRVFDLAGFSDQFAQIFEFARAVRVGEDGVLPSHMAHPVGDGSAFASVFAQGDDSYRGGCFAAQISCELEGCVYGVVCGAVGDDQDLPAGRCGGGIWGCVAVTEGFLCILPLLYDAIGLWLRLRFVVGIL